MTVEAMPVASDPFRVGAVFHRSVVILAANILPFGALTLVFSLVSWWLQRELTSMMDAMLFSPNIVFISLFFLLMDLLLTSLLSAVLVYGTVMTLRGQRVGFGTAVTRGITFLIPVFGVAVLEALIIGIGFLFFVIPGYVAYTILWVAVPVAVMERPGAAASLQRSAELTRGYRWRIVGLTLLLALMVVFAAILVWLFELALPGAAAAKDILTFALDALLTALVAVVGAVGYNQLRVAKEGVSLDEIAAVFD